MRVKPSALSSIVAILGYMVIVFSVWAAVGMEYDTVADTVENVQQGHRALHCVGAVYLVVVTTVLGWWGPPMREPRPGRPPVDVRDPRDAPPGRLRQPGHDEVGRHRGRATSRSGWLSARSSSASPRSC